MKHSCKTILLIIFVTLTSHSYSQRFGAISGKVVQSGQPVSLAQVFLSNTTFVTQTETDGSYRLENVPEGRYDLTVFSNYKTFSVVVVTSGEEVVKDISLIQPNTSYSIGFSSNSATDRKTFSLVKNFLLGNASKSKLINPEVIQIKYSGDRPVIRATSKLPIEVLNEEFGYVIFLYLNELELSPTHQSFNFKGASFFREIPATSNSQKRRLEKGREVAYYGSFNHFVRSLLNRNLESNLFSMYLMPLNGPPYQISEATLLKEKKDVIEMKADIRVIYHGQFKNRSYDRYNPGWLYASGRDNASNMARFGDQNFKDDNGSPSQVSYLHLKGGPIKLHPNGCIENIEQIKLEGDFTLVEPFSKTLPLNYQPLSGLVKRGN